MKTKNIRYIKANQNLYLKIDDVIDYLIELGSGEETDVRNRIYQAAEFIKQQMLKNIQMS